MTQQVPDITLFDPSSPEFHQDPYPTYRRLREADPIHRHGGNVWILTRYHDCVSVLDDPRFRTIEKVCLPDDTVKSKPEGPATDFVRLRKAVLKALGPSVIRGLQPAIQRVADDLLDDVLDAGAVDLMEVFCSALATTVFCEIFGIPAADRAQFRSWIEPIVEGLDTSIGVSDEVAARRDTAWADMSHYLKDLAAQRRNDPQNDLISDFLRIQQDGQRLTDDELASVSVTLLVAGHETTASLVGNATFALLRHPAELQELRDDPSMWPLAFEELLRYSPPGQVVMRQASDNVDLRGHHIHQDQVVAVALAAANRDPDVFFAPERLDLRRDPNPHLSFGHGPRFCIGSRLARVEALIALQTLITRAPALSLVEPPTYKPTLVRRAPASLWVRT